MSRRYEFLEPGVELVSDPEEMAEINEWDVFPPGKVFLVLGNPYGSATVIPGTPDEIIGELQGFIDVVKAYSPHAGSTVVDADPIQPELEV